MLAAGYSALISASEWAPQPWSTETTRASSGEIAFEQTPKAVRKEPAIGIKKPQDKHGLGADCALAQAPICEPRGREAK